MKRTDDIVRERGKDFIAPFIHYSRRPDDGENATVRMASYKNGKIDWTGVHVSAKRKRDVEKLQNLLDGMPKFRGTVYRGCSFETDKERDSYISSLIASPESLMGFISTSPDPVVVHHYAGAKPFRVILVIPNSRNAACFGPYSSHPEDEEALISCDFYLQALDKYEKDGIMYIIAEEKRR